MNVKKLANDVLKNKVYELCVFEGDMQKGSFEVTREELNSVVNSAHQYIETTTKEEFLAAMSARGRLHDKLDILCDRLFSGGQVDFELDDYPYTKD